MKRLVPFVLGIVCLIGSFLFMVVDPNIDYGDFEVSCDSIIASGGHDGYILGPRGGGVGASIVDGEDAYQQLKDEAFEFGIADPLFVLRQIETECAERRTRWTALLALVVGLGATSFAITISGWGTDRK